MSNRVQSLKDWFPILKWKRLPNFAGCQNMVYHDFMENYFINDELQSTLDSFITTLDSDYANKTDTRFIGNPGAGKTTFFYWMMKLAESGEYEALNRYSFYIFHANHAKSEDYCHQVREEILSSWERLYRQCGKKDVFDQINLQNEVSIKTKLNKLIKHYKQNRKEFNKLMVFIVDDVDLLSNEEAHNVLTSIKSDLELIQAMIWVSIRSETIQRKYTKDTKKLLLEMFSKSRTLPDTPLSRIIKKRVEAVSKSNGKNPFSEKLCDETLQGLFEDNKRLSLSLLDSLLSENLPKNIHDYSDESFIQNYIDNGAVKTLLSHEYLLNIHLKSLRTTTKYPLPFDIIGCLVHTSNRHILLGAINEIAIIRSRGSSIKGRKLVINERELKDTLPRLEREGLIEIDDSEVLLTHVGRVLSDRITDRNLSNYYNKKCKERITEYGDNELYWQLLNPNINYRMVVETMITWDDMHAR